MIYGDIPDDENPAELELPPRARAAVTIDHEQMTVRRSIAPESAQHRRPGRDFRSQYGAEGEHCVAVIVDRLLTVLVFRKRQLDGFARTGVASA